MSALLNHVEPVADDYEQRKESLAAARPTPPAARPASKWRAGLALLGLTLMFVIAALWRPADEPQLILCPFRALTHYPCPGCGMTRAFCALAHFEFWRAVHFNALSPLLFLAALLAWVWSAATVLGWERVRLSLASLPQLTPRGSRLLLLFVTAWWVARLAGGF